MTKQAASGDTQSSSTRARAQHHPKQWRLGHYQVWQDSGLTKSGYCSAHDIELSSFHNWVCRFQKESVAISQAKTHRSRFSSPFVEVTVRQSSPAEARSLTIGDITVGFDKGLSPADIAQWVKSLRTTSC